MFAAVADMDPGARADLLMAGAFVGILKPAPAADVIDAGCFENGLPGFDLCYQVLNRLTAVEARLAPAGILEDTQDLKAATRFSSGAPMRKAYRSSQRSRIAVCCSNRSALPVSPVCTTKVGSASKKT